MINKEICNKGFIWNPSNCECECDKSYDVGECLDYGNCKCRKTLIDEFVEECSKNIDENKMAKITLTEDQNKINVVLYFVLFSIIFRINIGIGAYFVYFHWYSKQDVTRVKFGNYIQTKI